MRTFEEIHAIAAQRHGGVAALEAQITKPAKPTALAKVPEDRWLSQMTTRVFCAGFNWKVIENKWPGFEAAFHEFDVDRAAMMSDDWLDTLLQDKRIVRNGAKILSVRDNAVFIQGLRAEGGIAKVIGAWPQEDYVDLLEMLKKRGARLGGASGQYFLRFMGVPSFITSTDVVARLVAEGIVDKPPTSKVALKATQAAFNTWAKQSGRSLTEISRVLAMSV